jgi:predicted CoA-binding protein
VIDVQELLKLKNWAVVGATENTSKFGYKVFKKLKRFDYNVYPVNPNFNEVDGVKCYHNITDIPEHVDVISLIVNPKIGMDVIEQANEKGIKNVWCQPGAESKELVDKAKEYGMNIIVNECVLVELR